MMKEQRSPTMSRFKFVQDILLYTAVGLSFVVLLLLIILFFLPYYLCRALLIRFESWQMNR